MLPGRMLSAEVTAWPSTRVIEYPRFRVATGDRASRRVWRLSRSDRCRDMRFDAASAMALSVMSRRVSCGCRRRPLIPERVVAALRKRDCARSTALRAAIGRRPSACASCSLLPVSREVVSCSMRLPTVMRNPSASSPRATSHSATAVGFSGACWPPSRALLYRVHGLCLSPRGVGTEPHWLQARSLHKPGGRRLLRRHG